MEYLRITVVVALVSLALAGGVRASTLVIPSGASISFTATSSLSFGDAPHTVQGYSTHPPSTEPTLTAYYNKLLATGATWQRTDLDWSGIQSTSSASFLWGNSDTRLNTAIAAGISTVWIIDFAPQWAAYPGCTVTGSQHCAPVDAATLATFCTAAAQHFDGKVAYWEVWNEPNLGGFWGPSATSTDYRLALNACSAALKAVNSNNKVIFGGPAPAATSGNNVSVVDFVTQAYAAGTVSFDIMGQHPYSYPWGLTKGDSSSNGWQAMLAVRGIMATNGDSAKKVWITEVGAPTCGPGSALALDDNGSASDYMTFFAQQQLAKQIIATSTRSSYIDKIFWYTLTDQNSDDPSTRENCFGALKTNGTFKGAAWFLKNT